MTEILPLTHVRISDNIYPVLGLIVYRITTTPSWHNFHIKEAQFDILLYDFINLYVYLKTCLNWRTG